MRKILIGVMGPGDNATAADLENAYELGKLIATEGWGLLTGGRKAGVMDAASKGAKAAGGLTIGILPTNNTEGISEVVDIAILTDMGNARNNINVLSSDVVIACGMGAGTASEVALALKNGKKVVLLTEHQESQRFFSSLSPDNVFLGTSPEAAIELVKAILRKRLN
ncbi:MAG: TIGR00725 family protein [Xenococcaceae cyanobacterium]